MKRLSAAVMVVVLCAVMASAGTATSGSGKISFPAAVTLSGTTLQPGDYSIQWTADGDAVKVVVKSGKQEVVTMAKLVELQFKPGANAVVSEASDNTLKQLRFRGKTTAISFE